jgi:hypothetical protein
MNKILPLLLAVFFCTETFAAGPVLWGPMGAENISSGPLYDRGTPYMKKGIREYVTNGSAEVSTAGWIADPGAVITRSTNAADNPRPSVGTFFIVTGSSANANYDFVIDQADMGKTFVFSFAAKGATVSSGMSVFKNLADNCSSSWVPVYSASALPAPAPAQVFEQEILVDTSRCWRLTISGNPLGGSRVNSISFRPKDISTYVGYDDFYFQNFENTSTNNFALFNSGSADPGTGTGGTASFFSIQNTNSLPLNGKYSLRLDKTAGGIALGSGTSVDFTVPLGYRMGASYALEFLWSPSANYAAGDVKVFIYDVTNSRLITPQNNSLPAEKQKIQLAWDASDASSYRLIFHVQTSDSTGWNALLDDVRIWPGEVIPMPAVGVLQDLSENIIRATTTNPTTNSYKASWMRIGNIMKVEVSASWTNANVGSGVYYLAVPMGLTLDTNLVSSGYIFGVGALAATSGTQEYVLLARYSNSRIDLQFNESVSGPGNDFKTFASGTPSSSSNRDIHLTLEIPIAEWADSPTYVASAKQAVVSSKANRTSNQTGINPNNSRVQIVYNNVLENKGGGSWSDGGFLVPASGTYLVSGAVLIDGTNVLANTYRLQVTKGANFASSTVVGELDWHVPTAGAFFGVYGSTAIEAKSGDIIYLALFGAGNNSTNTLSTSGATSVQYNMSVNRLTDEYGRPVVGFGYGTPTSTGLVKGSSVPGEPSIKEAGNGVFNIQSAVVTCSGSSSILRQTGSWVSSVGNVSSGMCTLTLAAGTFSSTPTCVESISAGSVSNLAVNVGHTSDTSVSVGCYNGATTAACTSYTASIICMGPR